MLLAFLLVAIALLIAVSIYCDMINYQAKQKQLLEFHNANNKFCIYKCIIKVSSKVKEIDIKSSTYYFVKIISIYKILIQIILKVIKNDEKSYINITIHCIGYVAIKDSKYVKMFSIKPLYLVFNKVNG